MQVTVPDGAAGGQTIAVQTPDGVMLQTVVPAGLQPGNQFMVQLAPSQPAQMQMNREGPDAEAARQIVASMVGNWKKRGSHWPCCFCPLIWQSPMTQTGSYTVHPLDANGKYTTVGQDDIWVMPFLGCPCSFLHICPIAALDIQGEMTADGTKGTARARNVSVKGEVKITTINIELVKIDASALKATYSYTGSGPLGSVNGTREVDGRAMTMTDKYTHGAFIGRSSATIHYTKVS